MSLKLAAGTTIDIDLNQRAKIEALCAGIRKCQGCPLAGKFGKCVPPDVPPLLYGIRVLAIGEAPDRNESLRGIPMVGPAGQEFNRFLHRAGLERESMGVTNIVKMRPSVNNDDPPAEAIAECTSRWLEQELRILNPEVVIAVGKVAAQWFFPDVTSIAMSHRLPRRVEIPGVWSGIVFPVFHPALVLHQPEQTKTVQDDFTALGHFLRGNLPLFNPQPPDTSGYWECTDTKWLARHVEKAKFIALDTESDEGSFWGLSISTQAGEGIVVRRGALDLDTDLRRVLESGRIRIAMQNAYYDLGILKQYGIDIPGRCIFDTMIAAYLLGEASQGLKELSYRKLAVIMTRYEELVGHYGQERALEYLVRAGELEYPEPPAIESIDWDAKKKIPVRKRHQSKPVIKRIASLVKDIQTKGADPFERWKKWKPDWLKDTIVERMSQTFPQPGISDVPDQVQAVKYSAADADMTWRLKPILEAQMRKWGLLRLFWAMEMPLVSVLTDMTLTGIQGDVPYFTKLLAEFEERLQKMLDKIWSETGIEFNPGSGPQVTWLLARLGIKIRKLTKKSRKPSTSDDVLEDYDDHPVVAGILAWRKLNKLRGYIVSYLKALGPDGRIHTTWKQTRTATGRLASGDPVNLQNVAKTGEGRRIRGGFVPRPGCVLLAVDLSQIEMRIMALDADCLPMLEAFRRGDDIHSQTMWDQWQIRKGDIPDAEYEDKRVVAKGLNFGVIFGITAQGFHRQNKSTSVAQAEVFITEWFKAYPEVADRMDQRRHQVFRDGYVRDGWDRIRWVDGVYAADHSVRERAVRETVNMPVQGFAAGIVKRAMAVVHRELIRRDLESKILLQVHDELVLEVPFHEVKEVYLLVRHAMETTTRLDIPTPAEGKIGLRWGYLAGYNPAWAERELHGQEIADAVPA